MDINVIFFFILIVAAILSIPSWPVRQQRKSSNAKVVRGWNVRRKCDQYPLTLSAEEAWDAVMSGDYEFEGAHIPEGPAAGGYFTNDRNGNEIWIPPGFILVEEE